MLFTIAIYKNFSDLRKTSVAKSIHPGEVTCFIVNKKFYFTLKLQEEKRLDFFKVRLGKCSKKV